MSKVATKLAELFGDLHQMYELPFETKDAVFSKEKEEIMRDN